MDGQMTIFDFPEYCPNTSDYGGSDRKNVGSDSKLDIPRAPIWHMSRNHVWEECPNCKAYNKGQVWEHGWDHKEGYWRNLERCPECGQRLDWSDEAIEKACKYSKDYLEAQRKEQDKNGYSGM